MKKILVVVDMQNDFLTGSLANESAVKIIPNIINEIKTGVYDFIVFTRDTHTENYLETQEGKKLPVEHCIHGTWGWNICDDLSNAVPNKAHSFLLNKPTFGYNEWRSYLTNWIGRCADAEFTLVGTCTDICVVSNALALKAALPEAEVKCIANCCAPLFGDPVRQEAALTVMESCQINVIR